MTALDKAGLVGLADRVEALAGACRETDALACAASGWEVITDKKDGKPYYEPIKGYSWQPVPAYTASLDAAMTLVPDDAFWRVGHDGEGKDPSLFKATIGITKEGDVWMTFRVAVATTPAPALTAAALRSIAAGQP